MNRSVRVQLFGRVQGVGFRYHIKKAAQKAGIGGWVSNQSDGSVLAEFHGNAEGVEALIEECRTGPGASVVEDVTVEEVAPKAYFNFEIR